MADRPVAVESAKQAKNENLPYSIVKYPSHYGVFIGFTNGPEDELYFCSCAREAIRNYLMCLSDNGTFREPVPADILNSDFPSDAKKLVPYGSYRDVDEILNALNFGDELCHVCNNVVPKFRYCHEMYGTVFEQNFGWYVSQKYYEYGICNPKADTLPANALFDVIPEEIFDVIEEDSVEELEKKADRFNQLRQRKAIRDRELKKTRMESQSVNNPISENSGVGNGTSLIAKLSSILKDGIGGYEEPNKMDGGEVHTDDELFSPDKERELLRLREEFSGKSERISDVVENEVRQAIGHYKKGNRWTSETILFQIIEKRYGDEYSIRRHYRPNWLDGLELDIFLEEPEIGIEYQGIQHYEPISHWGGENGLDERQERDLMKKKICEDQGVDLVEVRYDEELTEEVIKSKIEPIIE